MKKESFVLTEEEKKRRYDLFLENQSRFVAEATAYGFTEDQAIFLYGEFSKKLTLTP